MIFGQDKAVAAFRAAWDGRQVHHAWLLAGPRGVGKARFAHDAARRVLADAAGTHAGGEGLAYDPDHPMVRLADAGSHPDLKWLERLERDKGGLARNISIDQVRGLQALFAVTPSMSDWRVVVIDSADDMEAPAANALLKMLEEPPPATLFFLISHAPGRLLPTLRSRCRRLDFALLDDDAMTSVLNVANPAISGEQQRAVIAMAGGSAGRAIDIAAHDLPALEAEAQAILDQGDPDNARRSRLAATLGAKAAAERYAAFLDLVPPMLARAARKAQGERRLRMLDAYAKARELVAIAPRLSLDAGATLFQLGGILAGAAPQSPKGQRRA